MLYLLCLKINDEACSTILVTEMNQIFTNAFSMNDLVFISKHRLSGKFLSALLYRLVLIVCGVLSGAAAWAWNEAPQYELVISNYSKYPIENKVVEVPWYSMAPYLSLADTAGLDILSEKALVVPFQIAKCGSPKVPCLLLQVTLKPNEAKSFFIKKGKANAVAHLTYARYVPERYGDFAWENDRVAFRVFGKELEATTFNAKGIDVWAKSTSRLVINKWYQSEDYHTDHGEGLDFYGVGFTLGGGGCAPVWKDSVWLGPNYNKYEVHENGPLRTSFTLYYDTWVVGERQVSCKKTYTLDAGSYFNKIEVEYVTGDGDPVEVAMGINIRPGADVRLVNQRLNYLGYWLPADSVNGTIGVGVMLPEGASVAPHLKGHVASTCVVKSKETFIYYAGACWDKPGPFKSSDAWFAYVQQESLRNRQNDSITITIKKK
jgi:hypothetical protein